MWRVEYDLAEYCFALAGDDPELEAVARSVYSGAQGRAPAGAPCFGLRRRGHQLELTDARGVLCAARTRGELFERVEWALTERALLALQGFFQVHAGVVSVEGQGILLVGAPDTGKTSLVLAAALGGAVALSDEVGLVDPATRTATAFPRDFVVHSGTQALLAQRLSPASVPPWKCFPTHTYLAMAEMGLRAAETPVPMRHLVFVERRPGASVQAQPVGPADAARGLLAQTLNLTAWPDAGTAVIADLVAACPATALCHGDAREAADWLLRTVARGAP